MSIVLATFIVIVAVAIGIAAMLLVRRTAPDGSYFHDGDRAAGVFGVLATGFAVLLGVRGLPGVHELRRGSRRRRI